MSQLATPADDERVRALASEILARPEFEGVHGVEIPDATMEALRLFFDLLRWLEALEVSSPLAYWAVVLGLLAVAALLIAHIVWSLSRALKESSRPARPAPAPAPLDLVALARELAEAGRFLEATHQLLLATLRRIAHAGVIDLRPEDTNREVCLRLRRSALPESLRVELISLVGATERSWFRDRVQDPDLYRRWEVAYGRLGEAGHG